MKRERVEDLGRIYEITRQWACEPIFEEVTSKHSEDAFIAKYSKEDNMAELFYILRGLEFKLSEIGEIAYGHEEE